MPTADDQNNPARVKAVLIDPDSMTVLWMNESASEAIAEDKGPAVGVSVEQAVPMADSLGVPEALRAVAETGVPEHLRVDLVSTSKGSVTMVVSVYRLPSGELLVLTENSWQVGHKATSESTLRGSTRPGRKQR